MSALVELSTEELLLAAIVGVRRYVESIAAGHSSIFATDWSRHVEGAAAELAFAKDRGLYWTGVTQLARTDVSGVQVRHTTRPDGCLVIRDRDCLANEPTVLVTGAAGVYRLVGWIRPAFARREEWRRDPNGYGPAYFVPQSALETLEELEELLA
jgi:hypothetical protein